MREVKRCARKGGNIMYEEREYHAGGERECHAVRVLSIPLSTVDVQFEKK